MPRNGQFTAKFDIKFFKSDSFEESDNLTQEEYYLASARNGLRLLMMGWQENWQDILDYPLLRAIILRRDRRFLKAMRFAFQQGFDNIYEQLNHSNVTPEDHPNIELYLANCLSLLPYADLTPYESFKIPQYIDGQWQQIEYKVKPIELTAKRGLKRAMLRDEDRVFAYGLTPIVHDKAHCHLIFMGTAYPAGQGFAPQVATDLEAFATAGHILYKSGRREILKWLNNNPNKTVDVCGVSLGGSLSLLLAMDQGHRLNRVISHNPAGVYKPFFRKSRFNHWDDFIHRPYLTVVKQGNDPVSKFGYWPKGCEVLHVQPPQESQGPNGYTDHALNYAGIKNTSFTPLKVKEENNNTHRRVNTVFLYTWLRAIIYHLVVYPYLYFIRPMMHFLWRHKTETFVFLLLTTLLLINPIFSAGLSLAFLPLIINSFLSAALPSLGLALIVGQLKKLAMTIFHPLSTFNTSQSFIFALALIISLSLLTTCLIIPTVGLGISTVVNPVVACLCIPIVFLAAYKAITLLKETFFPKQSPAKLHSPLLARNKELDTYQQEITATISKKEMMHYTWIQRCLLKRKNFIGNKLCLTGSEKALDLEETIEITAPKAKIAHIKKIATLSQHHGLFGKSKDSVNPKLYNNIKQLRKEYEQGKLSQVNP